MCSTVSHDALKSKHEALQACSKSRELILRQLFHTTIAYLKINTSSQHDAGVASFLEANDISKNRLFDPLTLPPLHKNVQPSDLDPRPHGLRPAAGAISGTERELSKDGGNGAAGPAELGREPDLAYTQSKDIDSSQRRVDGFTFPDSSIQGSTRPELQDVNAIERAAGEPSVRPSEALPMSSGDAGSLDATAIKNLISEQRSSRPAIVHLPSKEAQEERLEHNDERTSHDREQRPAYESNGPLKINGLTPLTSGDDMGSRSRYDQAQPMDDGSRHDAIIKSQMDIARVEAFGGAPSTPDEQLRLEEARSLQPKVQDGTYSRQDNDLQDLQSMPAPSSLPSQFVNENLGEEDAIPDISILNNEISVRGDGVSQNLSERKDTLSKPSGLRDPVFSGMNGESPRDLTLSRRPPMRIDTRVPSTFDSSSSTPGSRPAPIITTNGLTPSGSATPGKTATPVTSIQSPPERMTTRVSSGALRHKSVSEILGETPKATPVQTEKAALDRAFVESHRDDHGSLQTPKSASSFNSPDPAVFKQRLSELKERERSKLSTVVFASSRNTETTQTHRPDENESPVEDRDYFLTLFAAQASNVIRAQSVNTLVKTAHKTLATSDHYTDVNERQACAVLKRIHELQLNNRWSLRQMERSAEPKRSLTHWDVLLGQMKWMRTDFREERKWRHAAAKYTAYTCAAWVTSSPGERKLLQIKIRSVAARATSRSLSVSTPDLVHSADDGSSEATDDDFSRMDGIAGSAPAAIFSLPPEMFIFGLSKSPVAEKLLLELPLYQPNTAVQDAALRLTDIEPDCAWKKPIVPVSKYAQGKMVPLEEGPPRKKSRFDYQDSPGPYFYSPDLAPKDSENVVGPEQEDVALFDPENKHIRDRIHAGHAFRPPSEHIMPSQHFFESRQSSQWTQAEDDELKKFVKDFAYNWSLISSCLSSPSMFSSGAERRTPWECFERWISLEGLPVEMAKINYFRTYHQRLQYAQKTVEAQHQALQQQQGNSANQMPLRRRTTQPFTVERRKNARHLHLIDAMRKLAKKRETAIHKQQHGTVASLAAMRKATEATKQRPQMHTPQEFSRIKANAIANQKKAMQAQKMSQQSAQQSNGMQPVRNPGPVPGIPNGSSPSLSAVNSHGQIRGSGGDSSRPVPPIPRIMNGQTNGVLPTNSHNVPHAPMQPNMQVQMQQRVPPMAPDRMIHEASRLREQQAYVRQQQQQQQHTQSNGLSGSPPMQHPNNILSQNNSAMLASLQGRSSPSINGALPPLGSSSSPRMTQPQALSSGMTPAVNQISSQFKARHPQASPEQITRMTNDQLYKMTMQAAAGNSNAAAVAANANMGLQVPSSMQQQAAMINGGGGAMFNIGNSQQYAQLMRQQQQSQQRGGPGMTGGSRSATPMAQRTGSAQGVPRPSQSPSSRQVGLAGGQ
ncbi:MAG: chromatin modification- protein VID21 [Alectoria sarmentosa]|nr:MAG: chromatin modification- protein VID21 [Alectoria sarmentosa]